MQSYHLAYRKLQFGKVLLQTGYHCFRISTHMKTHNDCSSFVKGILTFSGCEFNLTHLFALDRPCIITDDYWNSASAFEIQTGCYESKIEQEMTTDKREADYPVFIKEGKKPQTF